jgi:hypothetical protein
MIALSYFVLGGYMKLLRFSLLFFLLLALSSLSLAGGGPRSPEAYTLDTEPVVEWMNFFYTLVESERINAPAASRLYAYAGITAYESVLGGIPGNNSLAGQIWHMPDMPLPDEDETYDWLTSFNVAMADVTRGLFINASDESYAAIDAMEESQLAARAEEVGEDVVEVSSTFGAKIANEILDWVSDDGYGDTREIEYEIPVGDDLWVLTTEGTRAAEPFWGQIRPFILEYADACAVYPDVFYSTDEGSTFYQQAMEVANVERNLTDEQREIALFWVDTPGITGTPAGHWWSIVGQLVGQLDLTLDRAAEVYAMMGVGLGDSFISAWSLKYQVNVMRPITYIRANIRRSWSPFIESPPFPEYPSGHSVVSGTAWVILTRMLGPVAFTDETHIIFEHETTAVPRTFYSFEQAANEAGISRLYGGIHYRSAIENGLRQGECIGNYAMGSISLNPVRQGE